MNSTLEHTMRFGPHFDKLVVLVSRCSDDGIDCDECPVQKSCARFWDTQITCQAVTPRRFPVLAQKLGEFRQQKHELIEKRGGEPCHTR